MISYDTLCWIGVVVMFGLSCLGFHCVESYRDLKKDRDQSEAIRKAWMFRGIYTTKGFNNRLETCDLYFQSKLIDQEPLPAGITCGDPGYYLAFDQAALRIMARWKKVAS